MADEFDPPGPSKLRVLLVGALLVAVVFGCAYTALEALFGVGLFHRPFEREAWAAEGPVESELKRRRERMVRNLVKRHLELDMTRGEVEELLGPPDPDPSLAPRATGDWIYSLGQTLAAVIRFTWWSFKDSSGDAAQDFEEAAAILKQRALMIGFDGNGRVNRIEIVEI